MPSSELKAAEATDAGQIILDLSGLDFVDSTRLALVIAAGGSPNEHERSREIRERAPPISETVPPMRVSRPPEQRDAIADARDARALARDLAAGARDRVAGTA